MTNDRRKSAQRAEDMRLAREAADKRRRTILTAGIVVAVIAVVSLGAWAISAVSSSNSDPYANQAYVAPKNIGAKGSVTYVGAASTRPVKVTVYEDFGCPFCKEFEDKAGDFLRKGVASGTITLEWHPLAVLDRVSNDEYSTRSLNAAVCVLNGSGLAAYIKMHDLLFAGQPREGTNGPSNAKLAEWATQAGGVDEASCINGRVFGPWTKKVSQDAIDAGLKATPTVDVNGRKVSGAQGGAPSVAELQAAIARAHP